MPIEFDKTLLGVGLLGLFVVACSKPDGSPHPSAEPEHGPSTQLQNCVSAELGNKTPFCYISFSEALSLARSNDGGQYEVKAVLSIEFGRCVLHRDEFSARSYLDAESLWLKTTNCEELAPTLLGDRKWILVNVRGRVEGPDGKDVRRAGAITNIAFFEEDVEPRR